jgi:hypothetical protein
MMWCVVRSCLCWCVWLWCYVVDCGSSEIGNLCVYVAVAVFGCGVLLFVAGVLEISVVCQSQTENHIAWIARHRDHPHQSFRIERPTPPIHQNSH